MKNLLFYVAFLCLVAWAGKQQYAQAPSLQLPTAKADTSVIIKLQEDPATVQTITYMQQR